MVNLVQVSINDYVKMFEEQPISVEFINTYSYYRIHKNYIKTCKDINRVRRCSLQLSIVPQFFDWF